MSGVWLLVHPGITTTAFDAFVLDDAAWGVLRLLPGVLQIASALLAWQPGREFAAFSLAALYGILVERYLSSGTGTLGIPVAAITAAWQMLIWLKLTYRTPETDAP